MPVARLLHTPSQEWRWQVEVIGPKDHTNLVYQTPDKFLKGSIQLYRNGNRLMRNGPSSDFSVTESVPGTGYDTITLSAFPPKAYENLFADYVLA
jgi:hypothetical protein